MNLDTGERLREYHAHVQGVLLDCQFIEESLKMNLTMAFEIVRYRTRGLLTFTLDRRAVARESLGRLIHHYRHWTSNELLIRGLRLIAVARNDLAHRCFLLNAEEVRDASFFQSEIARLTTLQGSSHKLLMALMEEGRILEQRREALSMENHSELATDALPTHPGSKA